MMKSSSTMLSPNFSASSWSWSDVDWDRLVNMIWGICFQNNPCKFIKYVENIIHPWNLSLMRRYYWMNGRNMYKTCVHVLTSMQCLSFGGHLGFTPKMLSAVRRCNIGCFGAKYIGSIKNEVHLWRIYLFVQFFILSWILKLRHGV